MNGTALRLSCASALALAICICTPARAQTTTDPQDAPSAAPAGPTPNADNPSDQSGSGDIIVTALRRSESVLKVPATIAVLNGGDLRSVGVSNVNDVQNLVTGLNIGTGNFGTNISIRGVTSTDQTSKGELGIAFNIDGAFVGRGQEQGVAFFDLERVEVLKGPQGTLYGRSSTGGAINIITKKPVIGETGGYAKLEFGNYSTKRGEAAINIPISDALAVRFAGNFNDRNGYLKPTDVTVIGSPGANSGAGPTRANLVGGSLPAKNDQKDQTGRVSVLFRPTDKITATVIATIGHIGGVGNGTVSGDSFNLGSSATRRIIPNYVPSYINEDFRNFNEQLNWQFGGAQLDLLGSQQHFKDNSQLTGNGNPFDTGNPTAPASFGLDQYRGTFNTTQYEARLSNVSRGFFEYVVGANWYHEKTQESDHNWNAPLTSTGGLSPTTAWVNAIDPLNTTEHKSYGFFGQVTVRPTDRIALIGGLRYTHDESIRVGTFAVGNVPGCTYPNDCIGGPNNGYEKDHKITYKVGLNFQATPNDLFYASVSSGFKAGGFNDFDPRTGSTAPYGPESLTSYEIGYKGRPLPNLTFTTSAYYYNYSKDQINGLTLFPTATGVVGVLFTQLAPVEIYGAEADIRFQAGPATTLNASVAYQHSRIISLKTGFLGYLTGTFADFSGYALPNTPAFTANLSATHVVELGGGAQLRFRAATKISSGYYLTDYANAIRYKVPSFTRSDASISYAAPGDRYTFQLFVENIENKLQRTSGPGGYNGAYGGFTGGVPSAEADGSPFPMGSVQYGVATPRFYGVRLGVKI